MREIIIARPEIFYSVITGSVFVLLGIGFLLRGLYDKKTARTDLAKERNIRKRLERENDDLLVANNGYKARLKGIIHLATTSGSVEEE